MEDYLGISMVIRLQAHGIVFPAAWSSTARVSPVPPDGAGGTIEE